MLLNLAMLILMLVLLIALYGLCAALVCFCERIIRMQLGE